MDRRIVPLIMCGGAGTRLWPASREVRPKQFLPLFGARSTFQDTLLRVSDKALFARPIVITNTAYRFMVREQLAEIGLEADILLEPARRDSRRRRVCRETRSGDRRRLYQRGVSLEQRQLHVPRLRTARRIPQGRCRKCCGG